MQNRRCEADGRAAWLDLALAEHFHKRRHRTFDVTGAYLKGKFNETEVVYARPPPGERTYTFVQGRTVPMIWKLNVPLYGEVDAGYIWNRTATKQLVEVQGFNQSEHDPGYFWKKLGGRLLSMRSGARACIEQG